MLSVGAFSICFQQEKMLKHLFHSLPSDTEVEGHGASTKDKEREALPLYLRFFSDLSVTEDMSLLGRRTFLASGCQRTVDHLIFAFSSLLFQDSQKKFKNKLVSCLHSCYFIPNSLFSTWKNYSNLKTVQNHLSKITHAFIVSQGLFINYTFTSHSVPLEHSGRQPGKHIQMESKWGLPNQPQRYHIL